MSKEYWHDSFLSLGKAIIKLREAFDQTSSKTSSKSNEVEIYCDATIQRFEFTAELFWKTLKKCLAYEQIEVNTPREVLKEAYKAKMIHQEEIWLQMMQDRSLTSHTYKESLAKEIFIRIALYLPLLEESYARIRQKYQD